jgi:hypothetical protein
MIVSPFDPHSLGSAPMAKLRPYELRLQSERIADGHEGEQGIGIIAKKPLLGLASLQVQLFIHLKLFL